MSIKTQVAAPVLVKTVQLAATDVDQTLQLGLVPSISQAELKSRLVDWANALLERVEILTSMAEGLELDDFSEFLQRIHKSSIGLLEVLETAFEPQHLRAGKLDAHKLRHDGGNQLNQIIGYGEILQEDADVQGLKDFSQQLQQLQTISHGLMDTFGEIVRLHDEGQPETMLDE